MSSHPPAHVQKAVRAVMASVLGKEIITQSQADAANFLFDLESGESNAEVFGNLTANEIYTAVTLANSLSFEFDNAQFTVEPYYRAFNEADALSMLEDAQIAIESSLMHRAAYDALNNPAPVSQAKAKMEIMDINAVEIFGPYDVPEELEEWAWIKRNASFSHVNNGHNGIWEFMLNLSMEFNDIPEQLQSLIATAKEREFAYILIHQGT